jgi:hypothetical protein
MLKKMLKKVMNFLKFFLILRFSKKQVAYICENIENHIEE